MGIGSLPVARVEELYATFARDGYLVARGLLAQDEVGELLDTFMAMHAGGPIPGCFAPLSAAESGGDILRVYPRMMQPHRVNARARWYLLHPRILAVLRAVFGEEPLAAQSMLYFKPPTARGQALHQDDYYLRTTPGKCVAAWMALDPCDEENGGMMVVPGTQDTPILCPGKADPRLSFTADEVPLPEGLSPVTIRLAPGDVLFFNGSVIHGSYPNTSADRFRRSYIGHYVSRSTQMLSQWYNPLLRPDGTELVLPGNTWGGPCGEEQADLGA
jgi:ectoine hydroxylase-related dioxygenase (phytanoyl-CoA dioxygenase family)